MLDDLQTRTLLALAKEQDRAWRIGKEFPGGAWRLRRPSPPPEPWWTLILQGLCDLTVIKGATPGHGIWAYRLTRKGEMMARLLA